MSQVTEQSVFLSDLNNWSRGRNTLSLIERIPPEDDTGLNHYPLCHQEIELLLAFCVTSLFLLS